MASSEASYPTANGKRFTLDVDTDADVPPPGRHSQPNQQCAHSVFNFVADRSYSGERLAGRVGKNPFFVTASG